jgi:23S rRNA (cytosine1962-C5)-methyltransferase
MTKDVHAVISARGAKRWQQGHPWVFRSDVVRPPAAPPGAVLTRDQQGRTLGWALWSPQSEISLRLIDRNPDATIDAEWWRRDRAPCAACRRELRVPTRPRRRGRPAVARR